eukprot:262284-Pleurochrysis_carterae.AAC.2
MEELDVQELGAHSFPWVSLTFFSTPPCMHATCTEHCYLGRVVLRTWPSLRLCARTLPAADGGKAPLPGSVRMTGSTTRTFVRCGSG